MLQLDKKLIQVKKLCHLTEKFVYFARSGNGNVFFKNKEKYRMIYYREKLNFQVLDQDLVQRIFTWIVILVALLILNSPDNIWEVKLNLLEEPCPMICPFKDHLMLILQI